MAAAQADRVRAAAAPQPAEVGHGAAGTRRQNASPRRGQGASALLAVGGGPAARCGLFAPAAQFLQHLTVFVLACFVGWQVVWNVTPALHTPLMSVTNAISGIILIGGMLLTGEPPAADSATVLGAVAVLVATINVAGGFLVTQRMLQMFRR